MDGNLNGNLDRNLAGNFDRSGRESGWEYRQISNRYLHRNLDGNPDKKLVQNLDENLQFSLPFHHKTRSTLYPKLGVQGGRTPKHSSKGKAGQEE